MTVPRSRRAPSPWRTTSPCPRGRMSLPPAVQDAQRAEWNRYATAVAAHEDLHAADDKAPMTLSAPPWARRRSAPQSTPFRRRPPQQTPRRVPGTRPTLLPRSTRSVPPRSPDRRRRWSSAPRRSSTARRPFRSRAPKLIDPPTGAIRSLRCCFGMARNTRRPRPRRVSALLASFS